MRSPTHLCINQHEPHAFDFECELIRSGDLTLIIICINPPPPHQTATEGGTAPCQPPSPTTRVTTATPEAPTTALTAAAAAPRVSGLWGDSKGHSVVTRPSQLYFIKWFVGFYLLSLFFLISPPKYFPHLIIVVKHIIAYTP